MSSAVLEALGPRGIFRLLAPDRSNTTTLPMLLRTVEQLGFADPSVAWAAVNSNLASLRLAKLSHTDVVPYLDEKNLFYATGLVPSGREWSSPPVLRHRKAFAVLHLIVEPIGTVQA